MFTFSFYVYNRVILIFKKHERFKNFLYALHIGETFRTFFQIYKFTLWHYSKVRI
jgi:hypothetical protein